MEKKHLRHNISLVLPTYREKDSLRQCILGFLETEMCSEIIVVDNNSEDGTLETISDLPVRVVHESVQGYGAAIMRGLKEVKTSHVIICEPDGTFSPGDIEKILAYSIDCDVVFGSRTVMTFIWGDANMGVFLRWGNWFVAKLLEVLFNTNYLSDVGCTFRYLNRNALDYVLSLKLSSTSSFGLEMQVALIKSKRFKYVQIPVNYGPRKGESTITGSFRKSFMLGLKMIGIILIARLK